MTTSMKNILSGLCAFCPTMQGLQKPLLCIYCYYMIPVVWKGRLPEATVGLLWSDCVGGRRSGTWLARAGVSDVPLG